MEGKDSWQREQHMQTPLVRDMMEELKEVYYDDSKNSEEVR